MAIVFKGLFILSDNQGNMRSLFKEGVGGVAEAIETYSYYPNGALHSQATALNCNYTFGAKELQGELDLGWSDFGARCFDNWSAKWQGVDILAEANAGHSPYLYASANPVRFSDLTGMISEDEDGMMEVSTDLWGGGRNQDFMNQSANNAAASAQTTRNRQAGYIDTGSDSEWLSDRRIAADTDKYTFDGNYSTVETGREINYEENSINIHHKWVFTGKLNQEKVIRSTQEATHHYFNGNGESVLLHVDIRMALLATAKFQQKLSRISNGKTSALKGNFSVDMTNIFFHVGRTNVDYKINVLSKKKIQVRFDLFVRDGFWDPDFIDEAFGVQKADGMGPNLERLGGTPYKYISQYKIYNLTNPGYE